MNKFDEQYRNIMIDILDNGIDRPDRTGIGSRATWHQSMKIDLADGFPITTLRKSSLRIAFEETWFFLRGETDTKKLEEKKINIWKGNTTREFLDNRGLNYLPEGHMGKGYSFAWRNFGGDYENDSVYRSDYTGTYVDEPCSYTKLDYEGVDQISNLLEGLKNDPNSRRHIITAWNPQQFNEAALPACHLYQQYQILNGKLNSSFVLRSSDFLYGAPFNWMGYALLNHVFAKYLNLTPGLLGYLGEDVHLYENQIELSKELVLRESFELPHLKINKELNSLEDILNLEFTDLELIGYKSHPDFPKDRKPKMAV